MVMMMGDTGSTERLDMDELSARAPEVHMVEWWPLQEIVDLLFVSKCSEFVPVNSWQSQMFEQHQVSRRDPMYQTMATLLEIGRYSNNSDMIEMMARKQEMCGQDTNSKL